MPDYFPKGSNQKPSAAAPEIWTNFVGFKTAAQKHYEAADGLVPSALSKDADASRADQPLPQPSKAVISHLESISNNAWHMRAWECRHTKWPPIRCAKSECIGI